MKDPVAGRFHAHAYLKALNYYRMQLQRDVICRQPSVEQACRISFDPDLYYNPKAVPVTLEQPLQMPGEPTFRELKEKEESPLQRMEAGHERSGSVYLLYQVALKKAIEEVGEQPDDETGEWLSGTEIMECIRERSHLSFSNTSIGTFGRLLRRNNIPSRHTRLGNLYHVKEIE